MTRNLVTALGLMIWSAASPASDQQREQDYAQIVETEALDGKVVWLEAGKQKFLAIETASEERETQGAILLLHDMGGYPDQKPLIHTLRSTLPQHRWQTLSLQMPVRETAASTQDYYSLLDESEARVQVGLSYLHQKNIKNIAILGHGFGALTALQTVSKQPEQWVALITFSLALSESIPQSEQWDALVQKLNMPFLDIYAEFDLPDTVGSARNRRLLAKDNSHYRQLRLDGDDHAYQADADLTVKRVYSWLATIQLPKP